MAMIYESTANGMDDWYCQYREKYQADAAAMQRACFDAEYPISDIDPAKPGSDRTAVFVWSWPEGEVERDAIKALYDELAKDDGRRVALPAAKVDLAPPPAPPPVPDTDRMWDLLVLAARTSRYGE